MLSYFLSKPTGLAYHYLRCINFRNDDIQDPILMIYKSYGFDNVLKQFDFRYIDTYNKSEPITLQRCVRICCFYMSAIKK